MSGIVEYTNLDCEFWQQFGIHADYIGDGFPTCCGPDRCDACGEVVCTHEHTESAIRCTCGAEWPCSGPSWMGDHSPTEVPR